jgi:hypothetical protein
MSYNSSAVAAGTALLALSLFAAPAEGQVDARASGPHGNLVCVACHDGVLSDRDLPHVSLEACTECHQVEGIPTGVWGFDHKQHQDAAPFAVGCAGCHSHTRGVDELNSGQTACELCHRDDLESSQELACRSCHEAVPARVETSQGVEITHGASNWMEDACLRCHYQVSLPAAPASGCSDCHDAEVRIALDEGDVNLHPAHLQVSCASCHAVGGHRIREMSGTVDLDCAACHSAPHRLDPSLARDAALCEHCHETVHASQQQLVLGVAAGDFGSAASEKFLAGLSCTSCHTPDSQAAELEGSGTCDACHAPPYTRIAGWWDVGGRDRVAAVRAYLGAARSARASAGRPADGVPLDQADAWLDLVSEGGAAHNPVLSHRLLDAALQRAVDAYRASGAIVPAPPVLGSEPRAGRCSYCHYDMPFDASEALLGPPDRFHRELRGGAGPETRIRHP